MEGDALSILSIAFEYECPVNLKSDLIDSHYVTFSQIDIRDGHHVSRQYRFPEKSGWLLWWMDHLKSTFRFAGVPSLLLRENQFDFQSIYKTLGENLTDLNVDVNALFEDRAIILETLRTSKTLPVCQVGQVPVPIPNRILIGNFNRSNLHEDVRLWKIDDILQMNGKEIVIDQSNVTEKDLNRLLKFWMKGVWPRLERMKIFIYEEENDELRRLDETEMLRGIKHQKTPLERKNVFLTHQGMKHHVTGGWDIRRKDGTKATVEIKIDEEEVYVSLYV